MLCKIIAALILGLEPFAAGAKALLGRRHKGLFPVWLVRPLRPPFEPCCLSLKTHLIAAVELTVLTVPAVGFFVACVPVLLDKGPGRQNVAKGFLTFLKVAFSVSAGRALAFCSLAFSAAPGRCTLLSALSSATPIGIRPGILAGRALAPPFSWLVLLCHKFLSIHLVDVVLLIS